MKSSGPNFMICVFLESSFYMLLTTGCYEHLNDMNTNLTENCLNACYQNDNKCLQMSGPILKARCPIQKLVMLSSMFSGYLN